MSSFSDYVVDYGIDPIQSGLKTIGIDHYAKAAVFFSILNMPLMFYLKPSISFDSATGKPRPWSLLAGNDLKGDIAPTYLPWYMLSFLIGYSVSLFI